MSEAREIGPWICGSLRRGSYNMATLRTAIELKPPGMTIEVADISTIPLRNEDVRARGLPLPVETLRAQIKMADSLLFATPECNYSMSSVHPLNKPEVVIGQAQTKFGADGRFTDEAGRGFILGAGELDATDRPQELI
jgi:NADPH-dependent FMN reductase